MKKILAYALVTLVIVLTGVLVTAQLDLKTFTPNTPILSAEVNENFTLLKDAIVALQELPKVASLNALTGDLTLVAGDNVSIDVNDTNGQITISSTAPGSGGDITAVSAGTGLSGGGTAGDVTLTVAPSYRLPQTCPSGAIAEWNGAAWACGTDDVGTGGNGGDITAVIAGTGLAGGSDTGDASLAIAGSYQLPQACSADQVAKWNVGTSTWTCADDTDTDTTYTAGDGLELNGTIFSVQFAGSGSATTAARSDHDHVGQTWVGTGNAFAVETSGNDSRAISGSATGGANPTGVYGTSGSSSGRGVFGEATNTTGTNTGVRGESASTNSNATGVFGLVSDAAATGAGVKGQNNGTSGYGVWGQGGANATGVLGQTASSNDYGVWAYNSGSGVALRAEGAGTLIEAWDLSPVNVRFRVDNNGNVTADGTFTSPAADFAEAFLAEGDPSLYRPGDVLAISTRSDRRVTLSNEAYSTRVIGVYASRPGLLLGHREEAGGEVRIPVGVVGVIPTRVSAENGPIRRGDILVAAATPGHAMRADPEDIRFGSVIGKALEDFAGEGSGLIEVMVNVK